MLSSLEILNAKILIVDDQDTNLRLLTRILANAGYTSVASTNNPGEVCELHRRNRYDLILLDLQMPGLDGFEVMEALKVNEADDYIPVLAITAQPAHKLRALKAGARDFITKPFDQAEILMRIHNMLESHLLQIEAKNYGEFLEQMIDERTATLRESEELFRHAVEACPSGMVMTDDGGNIVMVNGEIERQFGYRREELIGRPVEILIPERMRGQHVDLRERFFACPESRTIGTGRDLLALRKDGTEFPAEIGLTPVAARSGLLVMSVIIDITERKRVERLKDEFVSMVSHELRTPLTSISGSLGLLLGAGVEESHGSAHRLLTIAQRNCQRLIRLLNDILDIEKMESGKLTFNFERIAVVPLVEQAIDGIRNFAESHGIRLRFDAAAADAEVEADSLRLLQVLTNLLSNAIKFSPSGGEVIVALGSDAEAVRISVRDHGPGIPEDFRPRMFEKFAQADSADGHQKGGSGLGLNIVRQIVDRLGGEIFFEDAPGGGTVFHLTLPNPTQDRRPSDGEPAAPGGSDVFPPAEPRAVAG